MLSNSNSNSKSNSNSNSNSRVLQHLPRNSRGFQHLLNIKALHLECRVQPLALGPVVLVAWVAPQVGNSKCCCFNKSPSPQPGNNPPNKWVAHLVVRGAMPQVARWVV